jgi:biotin operon repressor
LNEASPEVWESLHMLYKDKEKRSMCWQAMGEALNTSATAVQTQIHNLHQQVFYCMYCMNEL